MALRAIFYDFDGVMTDNTALVDENGIESVRVNRSDGLGINYFKSKSIFQMIVSTESNKVVAARAHKLGLPVCHNCSDKLEAVMKECKQRNLLISEVMFVGNDVNDYDIMTRVRWPVCPQDAYPEIREISCVVLNSNGGAGVVRELMKQHQANQFI